MPADLTYRNGIAQTFQTRLPAWHNEGTLFDSPPTFEEALLAAGLDRDVQLAPVYALIDGVYVPTTSQATHYSGEQNVLGVVGSVYRPIRDRVGMAALQPLIDSGLATIETGGSLRGGEDTWLLVRFDLDKINGFAAEVLQREGVLTYALATNNHTGRRIATVQETMIRVVCGNTFGAATSKTVLKALEADGRMVRVKHTSQGEARMDAAAQKLWGRLIERYEQIAMQMALLREYKLDPSAFMERVLDVAAPLPAEEPETKRQQTALEKAVEKRARVEQLWTAGDGHTGDQSAQEAFQGLVQSIDHDGDMWRTRGQDGSRLASLYDGSLAKTKTLVLNSLLEGAIEASNGSLVERIVRQANAPTTVSVDSLIAATA